MGEVSPVIRQSEAERRQRRRQRVAPFRGHEVQGRE